MGTCKIHVILVHALKALIVNVEEIGLEFRWSPSYMIFQRLFCLHDKE